MTTLILALALDVARAKEQPSAPPPSAPTRGHEAPPHKKAHMRPPVDVPTPKPTEPDPVR